MIVVKVELWPNGIESKKEDLGTMKLSNDGTGTAQIGNYQCILLKGRKYSKRGGVWRECRVKGFPRQSRDAGPWDLIRAALNLALGRRWEPDA